MTKSKAKKQREKLLREGKRDPVLNRGTYALADMKTRLTKTKHEKVNQVKHKKRLSDQDEHGTDGRFLHIFGQLLNYCFSTACPPNSLRNAATTFPVNVSVSRDRYLIINERAITGVAA